MKEICLICGKPHHGAIRGGKVSRLTSCFRFTRLERTRHRREHAGKMISRAKLRAAAKAPKCRCGAILSEAHRKTCEVWRAMREGAARGARVVWGRDANG